MRHHRSFRDALERFRRGVGDREEAQRVVEHLIGGCGECRQALSSVLHFSEGESYSTEDCKRTAPGTENVADYSAAFSRVEQSVRQHQLKLAEEAGTASALLAELERHPRARREVLVGNSARFHSWPFVEALLERARRSCQRDPQEAENLARLGILISGRLDQVRYGSQRVHDLGARSWAELGNVLRVQERYREAEQAFVRATDMLRAGTGDPVEKAGLLSLEASMWRDRHQFEHAVRLLDRIVAISRRTGERHVHGVALIQKALCDIERGRPEAALPLLLEAQRLVEPSADARLVFALQHNILFALVRAGRFEEAAAGLDDTRALCREIEYPVDRIRFEYLEGMVHHGLGRLDEAEESFRTALQGMLAEGLDYDAALVGLDLAALLAQQNRHSEVRELAAAMLPVFTSHRIHREAIAALLVFREAVKREKLSAQLVEELSTYLRNAASDPQLRFQPPAWLKSSKS